MSGPPPGGNGSSSAGWPARRWRRLIPWAVGVVLFGLITHGHFAGSGDPVHYMMIAHSLAFGPDLDMADEYGDPHGILTGGKDIAGAHVRPGRDGTLRPVHDVGMPLLWAPYFAAAYRIAEASQGLPPGLQRRARLSPWIVLRQLVSLSVIVVTALLAIVFFDVSLRVSGGSAAAAGATLLWALSPPILTHGYVFFTEIPTALAGLLAYRLLLDARDSRPSRAALAGVLSGLLVLLHVRNVGLTVGLGIVAAVRLRSQRTHLLAFAAPVVLLAVARTWLTHQLWGTLVSTPHAAWAPWTGAAAMLLETAERALALLFDQEHGLLLWGPLYLLAPAGFWLLRRRSRTVAIELIVLSALYLLPVLIPAVNPHGWRGGWSPAARFLVPIVPFLGIPVVAALAEPRLRPWWLPVVAIQVVLDVVFWSRPMLTWSDASGTAPFLPSLGLGALASWLPSWQRAPTQAVAASTLALVAWTAASAWAARRSRAHLE